MTPQALKAALSSGLLSFPVTDFDPAGDFQPQAYARRLEWLMPHGASALFVAGGTGEFFSLTRDDFTGVVRTAASVCGGHVPIVAGAGGPTRVAVDFARQAEQLGAQGILLLPHYLTEAGQDGLATHIEAVCRAVSIGVIVYNRSVSRLRPQTLVQLAERCPNLVGFKDGIGDIELMVAIRRRLGERFVYLGGLPTAEVYAGAYRAIGVPVYSSAVFNFIPKTAMAFYRALCAGDEATINRLLDTFFLPYLEIRNRAPGYAVSIVKAGARWIGRDAGPVRAPLTDLSDDEYRRLGALIDALDD